MADTGTTEYEKNGLSSVRYYSLTDENVRKFYDEWKFKTMAIIRKKGWISPFTLASTATIPTEDEASAAGATEATKKVYKANMEAYDQVLMGCSGIPLGLVQRADGDVRKAFKYLDEKYAQEDESNLTELIQQFTACKLEDKETDPDSWFLKIDRINAKLKAIGDRYEKQDFEIKAHLLGNLPEGYEDVKTKIYGNEISYTVRKIEKEIVNKWLRNFHMDDKDGSKKTKNLALAVTGKGGGNYKKFKGKCRKCGKLGHKALDCRSTAKKGVCFECGKEGHFARDCPDKEKKKDEAAQTGMFVGMLMSNAVGDETTTDTTESIGKEKFLIDSGATCHVVANRRNLVNLKVINEKVSTADKTEMPALEEGDLYLETNDGVIVRLNKVKVVPGIAKRHHQRWIVDGCRQYGGNGKRRDADQESKRQQDSDRTKRLASLLP